MDQKLHCSAFVIKETVFNHDVMRTIEIIEYLMDNLFRIVLTKNILHNYFFRSSCKLGTVTSLKPNKLL